jgi:membrane protein involved in D-alanine export
MIPYTSFLYFGVSLYVLLPSLLIGWVKKLSRLWIVLATLVMLVVQYSIPQKIIGNISIPDIWLVVGYVVYEWVATSIFLVITRTTGKHRLIFYLFLLAGLAPLLAAKFIPLFNIPYTLTFLGLSYVTFRSLDAIIGIQDGLIKSLPPIQYLSYVLFFPAISSGPIDRYSRFAGDWNKSRTGAEFVQDLDSAIHHVFTGFLYKFILAALIKTYWLDPVAQGSQLLTLVSYMYAYSLYLFFDFAGYSAFAVGFSHVFGIHTPENFNRPFLSRNLRDFWTRWHISLSFWFRDQIYSRFVLAALKGHWFKNNKYVASYLGFLITFGLMGLWHGTAWYYLLYGLYHGVMLTVYDLLGRWNKRVKIWGEGFFWQSLSIFITLQVVCFGLLIFSGRLAVK